MENKLGDFIRRVRGDMSLRAFGEMCNLSHSHIDSIEKGYDFRTGKRVSVTTDTIKKISEGTGIDYLTLAALAENIAAPPIGHILHDDGQPHKREIEEIKKEADI